MPFNIYQFWLFYLVVFLLYFRLPHKLQNRAILLASYVFYGFWDYRFLTLIAFSTFVDFYVARAIDRESEEVKRKFYLKLSLFTNLGLLAFFKYFGFFREQFEVALNSLSIPISLPYLEVLLPVGISFYTFQTLSYTIDVYRGKTKAVDDFLDFALYVSFFPQLVAGPIERSSRLIPQVVEPRPKSPYRFEEGLYHVLTGLFKKVVLADNMAPIVNDVFSRPVSELSGFEVLFGVWAFAFQIYGDFAGYSSIAQGISKWMGFDLMWNFRMPYLAINPSDFWKRWHISLSGWLRDYLYIPLGGNRGSSFFTSRNLMLTMLLGGLWHGAAWTFIVWGAVHGLILILFRYLPGGQKDSLGDISAPRFLQAFIFFQFVSLTWLLFRAETIGQAWEMLLLVFSDPRLSDFSIYALANILFFAGPLMLFEVWVEKKQDLLAFLSLSLWPKVLIFLYVVASMLVFSPLAKQDFIYFQF